MVFKKFLALPNDYICSPSLQFSPQLRFDLNTASSSGLDIECPSRTSLVRTADKLSSYPSILASLQVKTPLCSSRWPQLWPLRPHRPHLRCRIFRPSTFRLPTLRPSPSPPPSILSQVNTGLTGFFVGHCLTARGFTPLLTHLKFVRQSVKGCKKLQLFSANQE